MGGSRPSGQAPPAQTSAQTSSDESGAPSAQGGGGGEVSSALISYLQKNQGTATWLVAVSSAQSASSIILQTGESVIAMGGFSGSDPAMTVAKLKQYIAEGKLKYVLVTSDNRGDSTASTITTWLKSNATVVSSTEYGGSSTSGTLYKLS
jgi:4-amino-4-deoxy-L-arabinose transferase-like glycosyltransferase